jgi:hypothetical protein
VLISDLILSVVTKAKCTMCVIQESLVLIVITVYIKPERSDVNSFTSLSLLLSLTTNLH